VKPTSADAAKNQSLPVDANSANAGTAEMTANAAGKAPALPENGATSSPYENDGKLRGSSGSGFEPSVARPQSKKWIKGIGTVDNQKDPSTEKESEESEAPNLSSAHRAVQEHPIAAVAPSKKWIKGIGVVSQPGQGPEASAGPELTNLKKDSDENADPAPPAPPKSTPQSKKWIKGVGAIEAADNYARSGSPAGEFEAPYVEERGRASFCITNLDPSVTEDNLWKLFKQAGPVGSLKLMPKREGKSSIIAFVNFLDSTLLRKCREVCKALNNSKPSWNNGSQILVNEQVNDGSGGNNKRETPEQKQERLAKLREEFPWLPRDDPASVVKSWSARETREGREKRMTDKQKMELLFGSEAHSAMSKDREEGSESDSDVPRKHRRGKDDSGSGDDSRGQKRTKTESGSEDVNTWATLEGWNNSWSDEDAEERIVRESLDDWRVGRTLISRMGWDGERGLGKHKQGHARAIVVRGRYGRLGLGAEMPIRAAGIPRPRT